MKRENESKSLRLFMAAGTSPCAERDREESAKWQASTPIPNPQPESRIPAFLTSDFGPVLFLNFASAFSNSLTP